VAALPA